ncbi:MAG: hypothetical protein QOJ38_1382 [Solirubrobacterales bacterium]|jgi:hypothetical protein|nr:hypothetical protein [Solirubrobacterales bacterium]
MIDEAPGTTMLRQEVHAKYGGRRQGGISPSAQTANVFAITAPTGARYGYIYDGPGDDGYFHYTGEGQVGDQQMIQGNRAIRDHEAEGRDLHLFEAHGTELLNLGRFRYHDHYSGDAPEVGSDDQRKVIVFRLEEIEGEVPSVRRRVDRLGEPGVKELPVEQQLTERIVIEGGRAPREAERREQKLVERLVAHLESQDHDICRLQIRPDGEPAPLFCDVYDKTTGTLYEAKGSVARSAIRMAIGQLADYQRMITPRPARAVLLPEAPRPDLAALLHDQGISITVPDGTGFSATMPPVSAAA